MESKAGVFSWLVPWRVMKVIWIHADGQFIHKGLLQAGLFCMKHAPVMYTFESFLENDH